MPTSPLYVGIDLGTTNSTAAVFNGETVAPVRNTAGALLTPSVVRIDRRGNVMVGAKARRFAESDPRNAHAEFKRLMGTGHRFTFSAAQTVKSPEELSSLILHSLRSDIEAQTGVAPTRAVISVPALFELPQIQATSEAARLAGYEQIEMIQEPVASALAAGWQREDSGLWLVYDLGGGTFDVSLLETQDGLLRVAAHDGDNFLGGRDFDARVVDWMVTSIQEGGGPKLDRRNPEHLATFRRLRLLAEEAKIELTRSHSASIYCPNLEHEGEPVDVDLELTREELEKLIRPLIERTLDVCQRLVTSKGLTPRDLSRIVLVGGPTVIPSLRQLVDEGLGAPLATDVDPMVVVAQGAALFAAASGLDARPKQTPVRPASGPHLWLQHPAMTSDMTPFVVGKVVDAPSAVDSLILSRDDGAWQSPEQVPDSDGNFATMVSLRPRASNTFEIHARVRGDLVATQPANLTIIHGVALSEPPLSRSIGIALADDRVQVYAERGTPLPLRRTFTHRTVEAVVPGFTDYALRVPIVQGEFPWAHLCRLVGVLEIPSAALEAPLPVDAAIEVTLEVDRGGQLRAQAHVPQLQQVFDQVADLLIAGTTPAELEHTTATAAQRAAELRRRAFAESDIHTITQLADVDRLMAEATSSIDAAHGGDADAAQRARRLLLDVAAILDEAETARAWPELVARVEADRAGALGWIGDTGTPQEQQSAARTCSALDRALAARNASEVERQLRILKHLADSAYFRHPSCWRWEFTALASRVSEATNLPKAQNLVLRGQRALGRGDDKELERIVRELYPLLPPDVRVRQLGHHSGVR